MINHSTQAADINEQLSAQRDLDALNEHLREDFEKWYLSLGIHCDGDDLARGTRQTYFYIVTQALYEQWCEVQRLRSALPNLITPSYNEPFPL